MAPLHCIVTMLLGALSTLPRVVRPLPITSEPLANNPEHLTNDALRSIEMLPYRQSYGEGRKVSKSIFITPNFNENTCPPGTRYDAVTHRCQREVIALDEKELLTMNALQAFNHGQTVVSDDIVEYDYTDDAYGNEDDAAGPYHVSLTLSFDQKPFAGTTAALTAPHPQVNASVAEQQTINGFSPTPTPTTTLVDAAHVVGLPESMVAGSTFSILPNRQMTTRAIVASTTEMSAGVTTIAQQAQDTTTEEARLVTETQTETPTTTDATAETTTTSTDDMDSSATEAIVTVVPPDSDILENTIPTTTSEEAGKSPTVDGSSSTTLDIFADDKTLSTSREANILVEVGDPLKKELQEYSLLPDDHNADQFTTPTTTDIFTTTTVDDWTELPATVTPLALASVDDRPQIIRDSILNDKAKTDDVITTTTDLSTTSSTTETMRTEETVIVVTPEPLTSPKNSVTTQPDLVDITTLDNVDQSTEQTPTIVASESDVMMRQRETVLKHELNEDARVSIDQHNRFVYAHLEPQASENATPSISPDTTSSTTDTMTSTTTKESPTTVETFTATSTAAPTTPASTSPAPVHNQTATRRTLIDQLRRINLLNEDNRRRIEHEHRPNIFVNQRPNGASTGFRFPSSPLSATDATGDMSTGRSPPPTSSLFAWLPANWRLASARDASLDLSAGHRKAMNFWHRMPLIADVGAGLAESTDRATRANSRSPTDGLFRQEQTGAPDAIVAADGDKVFRVLTTNSRQRNR